MSSTNSSQQEYTRLLCLSKWGRIFFSVSLTWGTLQKSMGNILKKCLPVPKRQQLSWGNHPITPATGRRACPGRPATGRVRRRACPGRPAAGRIRRRACLGQPAAGRIRCRSGSHPAIAPAATPAGPGRRAVHTKLTCVKFLHTLI